MLKTNFVLEPRVLVLMATRNGLPWIEEQLRTVTAQQGVQVGIVVSDDQSTDATLEQLRSISSNHSNMTLLPPFTGGGSACANFLRLFREADCIDYDYVALCDQDDVWEPLKLSKATAMLSASGAALYSSAVTAHWASAESRLLSQCANETEFDFLFEGAGQGCTFVMSRAFFNRVQQFARQNSDALKPLHYHDWLTYALARTWNEVWIFDPRPGMRYRQHGSNDTGARGGTKSWAKRANLIVSGWYDKQVDTVLAACSAASSTDQRLARFRRWRRCRSTFGLHLIWAGWLLFFSRRRLSDRLALCAFAALRFL